MDRPLHDQKVGVWWSISQNRIIGPIFFNNTINSEHYCVVIFYPFIWHLNDDKIACGYLQHGAPVHTAHASMKLLYKVFRTRIISKGIWPPRLLVSYIPWLSSLGGRDNERHSLKRKSSLSLKWRKWSQFHQDHPSDWTVVCICKQYVYMHVNKHVGAISNICCNLSNVQGLSEYTNHLQ
jgi:hypothetical protein